MRIWKIFDEKSRNWDKLIQFGTPGQHTKNRDSKNVCHCLSQPTSFLGTFSWVTDSSVFLIHRDGLFIENRMISYVTKTDKT